MGVVLDVVYPRSCAGCGGPGWPFCPACSALLPRLCEHGCLRCGAPTTVGRERCRSCPPPSLDWVRAPFLFEGPIRSAIHRLKYSGDRGIALALGLAMAAQLREMEFEPVVVTWVPLGRRRRSHRGYDQARALAQAVAEESGTPCKRLLRRSRSHGAQARRGAAERRTAMRGVFRAACPAPPTVLLVDDVLTTGATGAACADALRAAGACSVGMVTAARSLRV